ncbi:MAG: acyl-CoA synthetase FdrA [Myxococcota bacterium]|nr:acyl-CoA synthetase FdrA [Myxococcota bacterium]
MIERIAVRPGAYFDSAFLMRIARQLEGTAGVSEAVLLMGTEMNRDLLRQAGFVRADVEGAGPMDLVIALRADDEDAGDAAEERLQALLDGDDTTASQAQAATAPATIGDAVAAGGADAAETVVSISVPGSYAAHVAHRALDEGCHVFLFSDNVSVEDEIALKRRGRDAGLLVMGPDCGTSILAGIGLGFANRVTRGPVGLVGPSGTGIQELCCGLDAEGIGISQALGTGGRDMSAAVGGPMTAMGIDLLVSDPETAILGLVAKAPADEVADRIHAQLAAAGKPAVVRYLGAPPRGDADGISYAGSLDEAVALLASLACAGSGATVPPGATEIPDEFTGVGGRLIGLFGGGSLAAEARELLRRRGVRERGTEEPWLPGSPLPDGGHLLLDTGDDVYTRGRPHPMVDQTARLELLTEAIRHPGVGVVLLDLVLGDGAHPDPAPEIAATVTAAKEARGDGHPLVICSVSGTTGDPQEVDVQAEILRVGGVVVRRTATAAARFAALMLTGDDEGSER